MSSLATIPELLNSQTRQRGRAAAITSPGGPPVSYQELLRSVDAVRARLAAMKIGRGDCVAIVLPNGPVMALTFLGVAATATAAPLNPAYRAAEFEFFFEDLKPKALIAADPSSAAVAVAQARKIRVIPAAIAATGVAADVPPAMEMQDEAPQPHDIALILHTSGTTSRPKMVPLTHENLCASAQNISQCLQLEPDDSCLNVMPLFHIHGLVGALLASLAAGGSVVCSPGFVATEFFDWLRRARPTWYTAVPTMHQAILARGQADRSLVTELSLRFVRSSSAALPSRVAEGLQQLFGVPVIEAYGMTEAAHQMCSNPRAAGLQRFGSVGPPAGPEVAIMNQRGELLPCGQSGEVVIRGENVTAGYLANPGTNARAFTHGWFRTGDLGSFDADGYLYLSARIKEIINRGGEKISPHEVEEVLLEHPAVAEALAFAMADARLGEEVAAAIVLRSGQQPTERELGDFVAERLADFKVPRRIVVVDEIPKGPTGKVQRVGMAKRLGLESAGGKVTVSPAAPQKETESALAAIWQAVLRLNAVAANDHFFQIGGDSILAAQVVARVRERWGRELLISAFFASPTLAEMAAAIDGLAISKAIAAQPHRPGDVPASPAQRRLWFLDRLNPGSVAYRNAHALRIRGPLRAEVLLACLEKIVDRHDALRIQFEAVDGAPFLRTAHFAALHIPLTDLSELPADERQAQANRLMGELARMPFDLTQGPLFRLQLLKLSEIEHILVFVVHHIIFDRWSLGLFTRELKALYAAMMLGETSLSDQRPGSYFEYAARQANALTAESLRSLLDYWDTRLSSRPGAFELPFDGPRPAVRSTRGDRHSFDVSESVTRALGAVAQSHGATLNIVLLAAFEVLLFRYTNQEEGVFGTVLAGRDGVELEGMIGLFANLLPVRCTIRSEMRFVDLLARTRVEALELLDHQNVPFDALVERLGVPRDSRRAPLFEVVFNFHNVPAPPGADSRLEVALEDVATGGARFDFMLTLRPGRHGLQAQIEYCRDLFEPGTIQQIAENFLVLLDGIIADPTCAVGTLPLLTQQQRHQLLIGWNSTGTDAVPDETLAQMFERQTQLKPDAWALTAGSERLTYRQLNERANQVAHLLRSVGVGPDTLVGVCLQRSGRLLVAIMGVLKSGGAYVPLDPTYPLSRLASILEDSQAAVLLTEGDLTDRLPVSPPKVVRFDSDAAVLAGCPTNDLPHRSGPRNLAYVIYTSGSTGKPKGVAVEQAGPAAFVKATQEFIPDRHLAGVLFAASVCFDLSVFEMFVPLCRGGQVIMAENGLQLDRCAGADQLTCAYMVPSVMAEALHTVGVPDSLRVLILGGEAVPESLAKRCLALRGIERVYDFYGPTEDTVSSTAYRVLPDSVAAPPIGRPFGGSRAYILDTNRQPVPRGVSGELYLGGVKLAREYLRRPELTAAQFMPDPFGPPGRRMYATGDLCRYRPDGNIQYIGRVDHQIKLRGLRIELGEIDAVLSQHPDVRQCSTTVLGDGGNPRLISHLTVIDGRRPAVSELRRHLAAQLPAYMVPANFVFMRSMPLDPSGKIDRRALGAVEPQDAPPEGPTVEPTTPLQKQLAAIWSEILGVHHIGLNDDFFQLGGHSLRAMIAAARMQNATKIEFPLRMFFEHPKLGALAAAIECQQPGMPAATQMPAPCGDRRLSHTQQRLWFEQCLTPNSGRYNVTMAQRLVGPLDAAKLEQALNMVIARHDVLRTRFLDTEGAPFCEIAPAENARVAITLVDCSAERPDPRKDHLQRIINLEAQAAFDLARLPLMRAWLVRSGAEEHVLVLTMHHIICDDWSIRILFDEMSRLYNGDPGLTPPPAQYSDFAAWMHHWMTTDEFDRELTHWKSRMAGAPPLLKMPLDRARPAVQTFVGMREPLRLNRDLTSALHALASEENGTVYMCLLAAFSALLTRWIGQSDIVIGAPIANRQPQFQQLIGLCLNTQPLRMQLGGDPTFRQLLQQARKTALDAYANQNLPFEILVDRLRSRRNAAYAPLCQVEFVHLTEGPPTLGLSGVLAETVSSYGGGCKFDMTLYVHEEDGRTEGSLEYNTDLFDRSTVRALIDEFLRLIRAIVAHPEWALSRLIEIPQAGARGPQVQANTAEPCVAPGVASRQITSTEQALMDIWRETLDIPTIDVNDDFFELGGTSFLAVRVFAKIERRLGVSLALSTLFLAPTVAQLAARVALGESGESNAGHGVIRLSGGGEGPPFFCISGVDGQSFPFRKLAGVLEVDCPIYGLQFDETAPQIMEQIAATFIDRVRQVQPQGPYRLIGYSFGGALAYEMAQQLGRAGELIEQLILIDAFVPGSIRRTSPFKRIKGHWRRLSCGSWSDRLRYVRFVARCWRERLLPDRIYPSPPMGGNLSAVEHFIAQIKRSNYVAYSRYRAVPYDGDMVLIQATGKDEWRDEFRLTPFQNGWSDLVRGRLAVFEIPAQHLALFKEPHLLLLAEQISESVNRSCKAIAKMP